MNDDDDYNKGIVKEREQEKEMEDDEYMNRKSGKQRSRKAIFYPRM
jgi:hypothetical protein